MEERQGGREREGLLSKRSMFCRRSEGLPFTTKTNSLICTTSYCPTMSSGTGENASQERSRTLDGSHSAGGACEMSRSYPSNWHVDGRCDARSVSHALEGS